MEILTSTQANFARWEPWHGKFGFSYPWGKYLKIGEDLRDLATTILSLKGCLRSHSQVQDVHKLFYIVKILNELRFSSQCFLVLWNFFTNSFLNSFQIMLSVIRNSCMEIF